MAYKAIMLKKRKPKKQKIDAEVAKNRKIVEIVL